MAIKWEDRYIQLGHLEDDQLLHLARNESAQHDFRLTAVEILRQRNSPKAKHPDLARLNDLLGPEDQDLMGVYPLPESTHESEIEPVSTPVDEDGPLKASVTTETMFGVQEMDTVSPADEAPISHTIDNEKEQ